MAPIPGRDRPDMPYVWPRVLRPSHEFKLVYLDLNHWISLAKAATGHRDGLRHQPALAAVRHAVASDRFLFLLSGTHYMEMAKIRDPRQRQDITDVMEELTGFRTLLSRAVIIKVELEAVLDELIVPLNPPLYPALPLIGDGVHHAFGLSSRGLRIHDEAGTDVTEEMREQWRDGPEAFDQMRADAMIELQRGVLRGPRDDEIEEMRSYGWDPEPVRQLAEDRAASEQEQSARLDEDGGQWRRDRTRDLVAARHMVIEMAQFLDAGVRARSTTLDQAFSEVDVTRQLVDRMPSSDIAVTLMTARHRNGQMQWTGNDIFDIDAMSVAVPYCDIVVTERHVCDVLKRNQVETRAQTTILRDLRDLTTIVDDVLS